jgi:hypothetical protein
MLKKGLESEKITPSKKAGSAQDLDRYIPGFSANFDAHPECTNGSELNHWGTKSHVL